MLNQVSFTSTALRGSGKKGILPKDEYGYYTMPIGGLNVFNSAGEYYTYNGAKELFTSSSSFMRRVSSGCLKGELGHPKMLPGQSMEEYANRIMTVEETRICSHFSEIWLDFDSVKDANGRPIIAIMAKVMPSGPFGPALESSLNNPKEDVCFSIRAFTEDTFVGGVKNRVLKQVVTFDNVVECGVAFARKYHSPSLESYSDVVFDRKDLMPLVSGNDTSIATESTKMNGIQLFNALGWDITEDNAPSFLKW